MRKQRFVLMCGDFSKNRRAQRLGVYRCFVKTSDNHIVQNTAQRNATKTENEPISIEKIYLEKPRFPNGTVNYYGFVKTGFAPVMVSGQLTGTSLGTFGRKLYPKGAFLKIPKIVKGTQNQLFIQVLHWDHLKTVPGYGFEKT